jgi:signal transduction histidine kinase
VLGAVLEREALLRRNTDKEQIVTASSERRVERLGMDLHDRSIQDIAAVVQDVRLFEEQLGGVLAGNDLAPIVTGRVQDIEARLIALHDELRGLSHSLLSPTVLAAPLPQLLEREASAFRGRSDIELALTVKGDCTMIPATQRLTVLRIVQEALSNAREHSGCSAVDVTVRAAVDHVQVRVADNGRGFDVEQTIVAAGERGRLGLVGINERARLVGGTCEIASAAGEGTSVAVFLPRLDLTEDDAASRRAAAR